MEGAPGKAGWGSIPDSRAANPDRRKEWFCWSRYFEVAAGTFPSLVPFQKTKRTAGGQRSLGRLVATCQSGEAARLKA